MRSRGRRVCADGRAAGVWKAPAGQEAGLVSMPELSVSLTDDENGDLNKQGINCLRAFPVYGRLVWAPVRWRAPIS